MRRTMSTISSAVNTTMKAVSRKPSRPGVTWSSDRPGRSDGVGVGAGAVARAMSKECTVGNLLWNWCLYCGALLQCFFYSIFSTLDRRALSSLS